MNKVELIDRAAVMEKLPQVCDELNGCSAPYNYDEHCMGCEVYMLHKLLTDAPTIDAAPVRRGTWVRYPHRSFGITYDFVCSECGCDYVLSDYNFCPHCGADMRGDAHD